MNETIRMEGVNKYYAIGDSKLHALKNVSLSVKKGEFLAVLGPSGSGKSTLMNVIGCMDKADSGTYFLDGIPIHEAKEKQITQIRNEKIGFIFQKYHLIPTYNVLQNIVMPLLVRGMTMKEAEEAGRDVIHMLGLSERIRHKPRELSGGQQQRVAIGRALITRPALILADEPTGNLDTQNTSEVIALLKEASRLYEQTIVMITHSHSIAQTADHILQVSDGVVNDFGRCRE